MAEQTEQAEEQKTTLTVTIDGREIEANPGELVIAAAERHGVYIPRFCYHPRMRPVGMCRMCIVEIDSGRGPALQPSCMVPVAEGMKVDTTSALTKKAQDGVLEFLLINHPLDCPVCDKGGECPLQDQTLAFGPGETRFVEEKRHFEKPIPISDLVYLDRERCILCDRCTRFAKEVAGDPLISFLDRGNHTQVNTFPDDPFASYFSGNTVQLCPVGALLARPYRFRARPWDLDQVESTCTACAFGCRVALQSSANRLVRKLGVDVDPVNWGWMCDKGRFDFEAVNSDDRLGTPLVRAAATAAETLAGEVEPADAIPGGEGLWALVIREPLGLVAAISPFNAPFNLAMHKVAAAFAAIAGQVASAQGNLVLYCSPQIEWCELMVREFEKATGIDVAMTRKSSGETFAQISAEAGNPRGDIWWGGTGDPHLHAAEEGLTEQYQSPMLDQLHDWARQQAEAADHRTVGIYAGALGFGYNKEL
ncbi:MAG: aldehyde dehydrogenase family protein, partial [Actinobacteria bacterium]|nr:aldehyde dehydrogenase family protein [Actinomycetota bacterium]